MVLDDYVRRLRESRAQRAEFLRSVHTRGGVYAWQEYCLETVRRAFAPRPRRTPLNPRITGVLDQGTYRVEKLTLESRPGFLVSANVYVPSDRRGPFPVVLGTCGHSMAGKAEPTYQGFCQRLVRCGFVVLIFEPCNQGERDQYLDVPERECVASCCAAHNMMGKQMELLGEYYGMWRAWDGIRCLDYLLLRPDVDPRVVGLTGNSGGGTMSEWLWAVDGRFTMAAPSCFVTTFLHNLENELPADCEQYPPGVMGAGLEMADLMVPRAPKPLLLLGQQYDFFDRRGLREAFDDLQRLYKLLGRAENLELFIGPTVHGYSEHNQLAMVRFFCKHAGLTPAADLEKVTPVEPKLLEVTPTGHTLRCGSRPVFVLLDEHAAQLEAARKPLGAVAMRRRLAALLHLPRWKSSAAGVPHYRVLRAMLLADRTYARYAVETEGDVRAILKKRLVNPDWAQTLDVEDTVHLVLPHLSSEDDLRHDAWTQAINPAGALYALDVRGLGESMSEPHGDAGFLQPYGMDYMLHGQGILFGESYMGRRVFDLLRTLELLCAAGAKDIRLYGRGQGALLALFAGVLHPAVTRIELRHGPSCYRDWIRAPLVAWPAANFLRGVLRSFDLPDLMDLVQDRLTVSEPWGPDMKPLRRLRYTSRPAAAATAWQGELRARLFQLLKLDDLLACRGGMALHAREIHAESRDGYRAREIEIDATPGRRIRVLVTTPAQAPGPCPAVVCIHGHGGTRASTYQQDSIYKGFAAELAARGYVTIAADVGQHRIGEAGRTLMGERLWDLMRCVDCLLALPEVDAGRLGCAGLSLGGEMAMWLGAMDERLRATVSSGFLTRMDQMERNHCLCWKCEGLRELVDFADIYALTAPRALLCQNGEQEPPTQFTPALAREALAEILPAYADLGKPDHVALVVHPGAHEVDLPSLLEFLERHLGTRSGSGLGAGRALR
jgi:dienelactone hydrolase